MMDFLEEIETLNKELNIKWKKYIDSKQDELQIVDKLKDVLGIINIREDISYDSKRKENIIESKKVNSIDQILTDVKLNNLSDLKYEYSKEQFISEYVIEDDKHIITNCFFENDGQDLYITEYTLSKLTYDLDTTIELLQVYSILEGFLYFYSNNESDLFLVPLEDSTKEILFAKEQNTFETKLSFAKDICNIISK